MTPEEYRSFVRRWRDAGPKLAKVRRQELRNYRMEEHLAEIHSLMELGGFAALHRPTSGLVEQQRHFQKARP